MTDERTVLIAMDGSEHADCAFTYYKDNLYKEHDQLVIVYCAEYKSLNNQQSLTMMSIDPALVTNLIMEEEKEMNKIAEKFEALVKDHKMKGKLIRVGGEPGPGICKVAQEQNADFIITGSRGLGTVRRTFLGSVSDYIVHHSHVPVLVCRQKT
ncbi:universal stress protein Slr1101-like [Ylistrum balloti]|uniref:universal stress protein Slr1101-like n=1 Tax=Ylistrum balloti TaxID=509963 RepID=UPI002905DAE8|nr:universal stress protein Slr1101-like [Ylistrum balloti]